MRRRGEFVLVALLTLSLIAHPSLALAQARDLGSPRQAAPSAPSVQQDEFGDDEVSPQRAQPVQPRVVTAPRARTDSTAPPNVQPVRVATPNGPNAQGRVRVRFEGDASRHFVISTLLGTTRVTARFGLSLNTANAQGESYALLCRLPCDAWLDPGAYRFGLGRDNYPDHLTPIIQINGPTQINVHYDDHALIRGIGILTFLVGLGLGGLGVWALVENEPDFAIAGAVAGGLVLFAGLGMLFSSDGVSFSWSARP